MPTRFLMLKILMLLQQHSKLKPTQSQSIVLRNLTAKQLHKGLWPASNSRLSRMRKAL